MSAPSADLLICAVLARQNPKLIKREMLDLMEPGSVLVDIAIDQGGCAETSPYDHLDPVFTEHGVIHYCVANMPGTYARTATQALTNATLPYAVKLATLGLDEAIRKMLNSAGVNVIAGNVVHQAVADAHGLPFRPWEEVGGE